METLTDPIAGTSEPSAHRKPGTKQFLICAFLGALAISAAGCVFHHVQVQPVIPADAVVVTSPVKAHLKDGSTVVYAKGVTVSGGMLRGTGVRYDLALKQSTNVDSIPLDSVLGMESFQTRVNGAETAIVTTLVTAAAVVGGVALFKAIFGSCPTVYSGDGTVAEAELFSNSIAPLFEARDVDRLQAQPNSKGILRLEVRNEALETHYINHLQLFEVAHAADEFVLPDAEDHPAVVRGVRTPTAITDRSGQDLRVTMGAADDKFYRTDRRFIDNAKADDVDDWIDLTADVPGGADSVTLVLPSAQQLTDPRRCSTMRCWRRRAPAPSIGWAQDLRESPPPLNWAAGGSAGLVCTFRFGAMALTTRSPVYRTPARSIGTTWRR